MLESLDSLPVGAILTLFTVFHPSGETSYHIVGFKDEATYLKVAAEVMKPDTPNFLFFHYANLKAKGPFNAGLL